MARKLPRYPIYVISKGRWDVGHTANFLMADGLDFSLVVEPQEAPMYAAVYGEKRLLALPFSNLGQGSIPARNWCWEHALGLGAERHWILDDNMFGMYRWHRGKRLPCHSNPAIRLMEDFVDRYDNVAIAGPTEFGYSDNPRAPFVTNCHVYSFLLIWNALPCRWRGRYNEDTDLCLQALARGWCTVQFRAVMMDKATTMTMKGGNTDTLYVGDGRLEMARSLERQWPGVVRTIRRYGRPQHVVDWKRFDTPLKLRPGIDLQALAGVNNYGMSLKVKREVKSPRLRALITEES